MSAPIRTPFLKMHGLGNDFVVIDDLVGSTGSEGGVRRAPGSVHITPALAARMGHRQFGVGFDQLLWLRPAGTDWTVTRGIMPALDLRADARMEIFNPDGSMAEMCGNGVRAAALYLSRHGPKPGLPRYRIETLGGLKEIQVADGLMTVDMGVPGLKGGFGEGAQGPGEELLVGGFAKHFFEVDMGNPHAVFFVPCLAEIPFEKWGPEAEKNPRFPYRSNIEFVEGVGPSELRVRVWERGAGPTLACGTGACAAAVAALFTRRCRLDPESGFVRVHLPGGELAIRWDGPGKPVLMRGPATEVFRGEFLLEA